MDAKDEIKQRLSIEEVISDYLELKRAGRNFKALSPFSSEKTASFMVSPEKQIWHDFSSNKGGDMFSFVMKLKALSFANRWRFWRARLILTSVNTKKRAMARSQHSRNGFWRRILQRRSFIISAFHERPKH